MKRVLIIDIFVVCLYVFLLSEEELPLWIILLSLLSLLVLLCDIAGFILKKTGRRH